MTDSTENIRSMRAAGNIQGLIKELRCREHVQHRQTAVEALGNLGDNAAIPWLLKAALYDPDLGVRAGAMSVLKNRIMGDLELALRVEASGEPDEDPWLMDCHSQPAGPPDRRAAMLAENRNVDRLVRILRDPQDAALRALAAGILGELGDQSAAEALANAFLYDPETEVQEEARRALNELLGKQAELAIQAASYGSDEESWLVLDENGPTAEFDSDDEEPADGVDMLDLDDDEGYDLAAEEDEIHSMVTIAHQDSNPELRLRAVRALGEYTHLGSHRALANLALNSPDKQVQAEAQRVLEEKFGDDLPEFLEAMRQEDEIENPGITIEADAEATANYPRVKEYETGPTLSTQPTSVIQEDRTHPLVWVLLGLGLLLLIGAMVWLLILR